ncbi:hypothetical protein [Microbulbifer sp. PSTR4-B]|uniref:hypothetical protein n=1 Tax=unclassified Microbulbifer TaxID=2619833 RepID=UPI00403AA86C
MARGQAKGIDIFGNPQRVTGKSRSEGGDTADRLTALLSSGSEVKGDAIAFNNWLTCIDRFSRREPRSPFECAEANAVVLLLELKVPLGNMTIFSDHVTHNGHNPHECRNCAQWLDRNRPIEPQVHADMMAQKAAQEEAAKKKQREALEKSRVVTGISWAAAARGNHQASQRPTPPPLNDTEAFPSLPGRAVPRK